MSNRPVDVDKTQSDTLEEAYFDRNQAVLLAARLARTLGLRTGWHTDPDEPGWPVLFIELPTGQVSWHIPKAEADTWHPIWFSGWDGHTLEQKRERISDFLKQV